MDYAPEAPYYTLIILYGLILGSFFNVLIYRLPRNLSIISPRSFCPICQQPISWYHNIPVLSFLVLRGRCSSCRGKIPLQYPAIELGTALAAVAAAKIAGIFDYGSINPESLGFLILIPAAIPISVIDVRQRIIPNMLTIPLLILGLGTSFIPGGIDPLTSFLGLIIGAGVLFVLSMALKAVFKRESLGMGDIKLVAAFGAFLGPLNVLIMLFCASTAGLAVAAFLRIRGKDIKELKIPFGPFLCVGMIAVVYFYPGY
jgi:leader peptidase (prepilin peptidase)/N-methyltransferase